MRAADHIAEHRPFIHRDFYPTPSPKQQIDACLVTLQAIVDDNKSFTNTEPQRNVVLAYRDLLARISARPLLANDSNVAQRTIKTTVALLDMAIIDEISVVDAPSGMGKNVYARLFALGTPQFRRDSNELGLPFDNFPTYFVTNAEKEKGITDALRDKNSPEKTVRVSSVNDFLSKNVQPGDTTRFVFTQDITVDEYHLLWEKWLNKFTPPRSLDHFNILIPISLNSEVGILLGDYRKKSGSPHTHLPRQDIYNAFFESGLPIIDSVSQTQSAPNNLVEDNETLVYMLETFLDERHLKELGYHPKGYLERKMRWLGTLFAKKDLDPQNLLSRHEEFYRHNYGPESNSVVLTRSGVGANEAAQLVALNITGNSSSSKRKAMVVGGENLWYVENKTSVKHAFHLTTDITDARVLFVSYEPVHPYLSSSDNKPYSDIRDETIKSFLTRARTQEQNGNTEPLVIVIDKTNDPLFSISKFGELPKHVVVLETASITKHQKGGTNYFFGGIWSYGDLKTGDVTAKVREAVTQVKANVTNSGIVHIPRIRRSETERLQEKRHEAGVVFQKAFLKAQEMLPEQVRIHTQAYGPYTFIVPPFQISEVSVLAYNVMHDAMRKLNVPPVLSFNLDGTTRNSSSETINIGGVNTFVHYMRLSYGTNFSLEHIERIAESISRDWVEYVEKNRENFRRQGYLTSA